MLQSFNNCFNLVNAAVVGVILESISGLEPSPSITEPRYLTFVTDSSVCPFSLISVLVLPVLLVINLAFSAMISIFAAVLWRLCRDAHLSLPVLLLLRSSALGGKPVSRAKQVTSNHHANLLSTSVGSLSVRFHIGDAAMFAVTAETEHIENTNEFGSTGMNRSMQR